MLVIKKLFALVSWILTIFLNANSILKGFLFLTEELLPKLLKEEYFRVWQPINYASKIKTRDK